MNLFTSLRRLEAVKKYCDLCVKFDNVWGKPIPPTEQKRDEIIQNNHMSYEDDELQLYFGISFNVEDELWFVVKKCYINGIKSNRKGLNKFIN